MGHLVFLNPNKPAQPVKGVYRWFYLKRGEKITLYVGNAGKKDGGIRRPSTLSRGISEAQGGSISANKGHTLDTDFIVGAALRYVTERKKLDCYWEHISNDPGDELCFCRDYGPRLQNEGNSRIKKDFKLAKPNSDPWKNTDRDIAEQKLFKLFETMP